MKLREFKKLVNEIDDKFLDADILVDTDAAEFSVHMVDPISVDAHETEEMGKPFVSINLDHSVKIHWSAQDRIDYADRLKKEMNNEVPKV